MASAPWLMAANPTSRFLAGDNSSIFVVFMIALFIYGISTL